MRLIELRVLRRPPNQTGHIMWQHDQLANLAIRWDRKRDFIRRIGIGLPLHQETGGTMPVVMAEAGLYKNPA